MRLRISAEYIHDEIYFLPRLSRLLSPEIMRRAEKAAARQNADDAQADRQFGQSVAG